MSRWFFNSKDKQEVLRKELEEWIGTPFRHRAAVKKVGADCIHFVAKAYENVGVVKDVIRTIPSYGHDWAHHTTNEILYNHVKTRKEFQEVKYENIMNGDMALYKFGLASSHCAIYFDGQIYQAISHSKIHKLLYIDKSWYVRRTFLFRARNV